MQEPPLLAAGFLVDMIAAQQLFAFHLPDMCARRSKSSTLFNIIADQARLHGSILSVLGYFPKQEVRVRLPRACIESLAQAQRRQWYPERRQHQSASER